MKQPNIIVEQTGQGETSEEFVRLKELLQITESNLQSIFNNMMEGVALHELLFDEKNNAIDYRYLSVNPAFDIQTGIEPSKLVGKTASEVFHRDIPPFLDTYTYVVNSGQPATFETFFAPMEKHFRISVSSPGKNQFITVFEDITERKKADEKLHVTLTKYQALFDTYPVGITISDDKGNIIESNLLAEKLLGIPRDEQEKRTIGGEEWHIVRPDGSPMPTEEFASVRAMNENRRVDNVEMGIVKGRDKITWINVSAAPVPLKGFGVAITYHDITVRKQTERMLSAKNEELERTLAEKDKFFSIIAHDLRNPFNTFLGFTQMMAEDLDDLKPEMIRKLADSMRKSATNLYALLENLLEWSRMQRGVITCNPSVNELLPIMDDALAMIKDAASKKEITIRYLFPANFMVYADEKMLKTILRNLVSNSVKFTHRGGEVLINAMNCRAHQVEISIKDTGIGIPNELKSNLFSLINNQNRKGTDNESSTGLGLIICKEFVEKHGGEIWVESVEGEGTIFSFSLPGEKAEAQQG